MKYAVVIERGPASYGAYIPDLPGCVAVGESREEAEALIGEAVSLHIKGLVEDGLPVPEASSSATYVEVGVPPTGAA